MVNGKINKTEQKQNRKVIKNSLVSSESKVSEGK